MDATTHTNRNEAAISKYTNKIAWTTGSGKVATVTVELETETYSHRGFDGAVVTKPCCNLLAVATVEGMGDVGGTYRRVSDHHQGVAAQCGKLGIMEINAVRIDAAIAAIESSPEWAAKLAKRAKADAAAAAYDAGRKIVDNAMTGNGRTY